MIVRDICVLSGGIGGRGWGKYQILYNSSNELGEC